MTDIRRYMNLVESTLMELTPYRGSEEFKAMSELIGNSKPVEGLFAQSMATMKLFSAFMGMLEAKGFKKLGNGAFATVFTHPGINYAIKIFGKDPAYAAYAALAQSMPNNPHVPKYRGKSMKIDDNHFAVRMEKLTDLNYEQANQVGRCIRAYVTRGYDWEDCEEEFEYNPEFAEVAEGLRKLVIDDGFGLDLHAGNIMARGKTFVITDPLVVKN